LNKPKKEKHGSIHHILARSRGGPRKAGWNKAKKKNQKHQAFHTLARALSKTALRKNLLPCEFIHKILEHWSTKSGNLKKSALTDKQLIAWEDLFGNASPSKAAEIIRKYWTVKNHPRFKGCFSYEQCFKNNDFKNPNKKCPLVKMYEKGEI